METKEWKKVPILSLPERAGFGAAVIENKMYLFGGMVSSKRFLNDLYYLSLSTWQWDPMFPSLAPGTPPPCARVGHSFTKVNNHLILLFAGVTDPNGHFLYLNDLYALDLGSDDTCTWRLIVANGAQPVGRESHSACLYKPNLHEEKLIIYGGMNGYRLDDVWSLDINTYTWSEYIVPWGRNTPPARSMHAATIAGSRMFVFGGWAPPDEILGKSHFFKPQELCCFDLVAGKWEKLDEESLNHSLPPPRTGHSLVVIEDKIYMWSGRIGEYLDKVTMVDDLWSLQVTPQKVMNRFILSDKTYTMFNLEWDPVPLASCYILQIQVMTMPPVRKPESTARIFFNQNAKSASSPCINHPKINSTPAILSPIPTKNDAKPIVATSENNTHECLTSKFHPKPFSSIPSTRNTTALSVPNTITSHKISNPRVSISAGNRPNSKSLSTSFNPNKQKNTIPIVTTRVCFSAGIKGEKNPLSITPPPSTPVSVIDSTITHNSVIKTPSISPVIHTSGFVPVTHTPSIAPGDILTPDTIDSPDTTNTPGITHVTSGSTQCGTTQVAPVTSHTPGITHVTSGSTNVTHGITHVTPGITHVTSGSTHVTHGCTTHVAPDTSHTPGITHVTPGITHVISGSTHATPGITHVTPGTSHTPGITHVTPGIIHATPGITHATPGIIHVTPGITHVTPISVTSKIAQSPGTSTAVIYSSVVTTPPVNRHRSTLETFLKPKLTLTNRPASVKLMRSSTGTPVAVIPKSLIPSSSTITCGSKSSNIVIVARKRPYK
ncbi:host cell factor 1-like isoform X2 [Nilaparvata lugens]|nr:host cell factor 1-like isoform X2 [Nilaparvata lugens]